MKLLISAYACEPGAGSEAGAGWSWTRAAALEHDVWLLTRQNNRSPIEQALQDDPTLRLHPVYLDLPERWRRWKRGRRGARSYYLLWQIAARRSAKALHASQRFDVAHHLTFAVDSMPAGVVGIRGLPSIWGPVGGASPFPWRLVRWLGVRSALVEMTRFVASGAMRLLFGRWNARCAALVIAQNYDVARAFRRHSPLVEPNVAIEEPVSSGPTTTPRSRDMILFVGRLVAAKGIFLAVDVLARPEASSMRLRVYGDGPARRAAERRARRRGVDGRVEFVGQCSRHEVLRAYEDGDVLLFPSMRDSAPWAVAEAVLAGVPFVALDVGGPAILAERTRAGHLTQPGRNASGDLARALSRLASAPPPAATACRTPLKPDRLPALLRAWYAQARE